MTLLHFSGNPLTEIYDVEQGTDPDHKPHGLWVSAGDGEDGWRAWCQAEGFGLKRLSYVTEIRLRPDARILHLSSAEDIDRFHSEYVRAQAYETAPSWRWAPRNIGWREVADKYDGIIIAPYVWERRHCDNAKWYYSWDVASGCIWRARAAEVLESRPYQLPETEVAA